MVADSVAELNPQEAWRVLQEAPQAALVDIRSTMEYLFVGHPSGALHVPWIDEPSWDVDPDFVAHLIQELGGDAAAAQQRQVILICRSGNRSEHAGRLLQEHGFRQVAHVADGFEGELDAEHHRGTLNGWRFEGLPWEQC